MSDAIFDLDLVLSGRLKHQSSARAEQLSAPAMTHGAMSLAATFIAYIWAIGGI